MPALRVNINFHRVSPTSQNMDLLGFCDYTLTGKFIDQVVLGKTAIHVDVLTPQTPGL